MNVRRRKTRAFTLAECLVAATVLAVAVLAIGQAIVAGQKSTFDALHTERAVSLAESLLEEILALPYADPGGGAVPGPDTGETGRTNFDNIDDFHGFSEDPGELADAAGDLYAQSFQEFSRSVTAAYATADVDDFNTTFDGLTVIVNVTDTNGRIWSVVRFIPEPIE